MKNTKNAQAISMMGKSLLEVFKNPIYVILSFLFFSIILLIAIWLPNFYFVSHTITTSELTFIQKFNLLVSSLGALDTNFTYASKYITIIASLLAAVNLTLLIYFFKKRLRLQKEAGVGIGGVMLGFLGIGCASCGSVIVSSILGTTLTASLVGKFPFHGLEFGVIGIIFILLSIILLTKKIQEELYCKI